jgi:hypothetical protein
MELYVGKMITECCCLLCWSDHSFLHLLSVDWYLMSNILFIVGVLGDISNTVADEVYAAEPTLVNRIVALTAVILWILSAMVDLTRCLVDKHNRKRISAPIQTTLIPTRDPNRAFSFSMLGALLFMVANFFYLSAELFCWHDPDLSAKLCTLCEFFGASLFILNGLSNFADYRQRHTLEMDETRFSVMDDRNPDAEEAAFERAYNGEAMTETGEARATDLSNVSMTAEEISGKSSSVTLSDSFGVALAMPTPPPPTQSTLADSAPSYDADTLTSSKPTQPRDNSISSIASRALAAIRENAKSVVEAARRSDN